MRSMAARAVVVLTVVLSALAAGPRSAEAARKPDPLAAARRFYNLAQYDQAIDAAREAASRPATMSAARLIVGRSRLERYRQTQAARDLDDARADLQAVDPAALDLRERVELQVGLGELLFFEERFGAAAELLAPVVDSSPSLAPDARARALDWWATALDRQAQALPAAERAAMLARVIGKMEEELRREPASAPAGYWIAAASRAAGDLDRAWSAAMAGWIRATLARDRGIALRSDLDKLVTEGIIPDRAAKSAARDRRQAAATLTTEWENFKKLW
jgi:tetratricopeptide (TPR) repeat protein